MNLNDELARQYLAECHEQLAVLEADLISLEGNVAAGAGTQDCKSVWDSVWTDEPRVNRAFQAVQAVRRGAVFFDLVKIDELANRTEDALSLIRARKMTPTAEHVGVLLGAADRLLELIQNPAASNEADITDTLSPLAALCAECNTGSSAHQRLRVLLVEDDFANRILLQTFLSRYGECHVAMNGVEAVAAFRRAEQIGQKYDLICMDIMMPEMDGREAVRHLRALEEAQGIFSTDGAKIIMTTAVTDIREVSRCFEELCDAYLTKPIDLKQLLAQMKLWQLVR